MESNGEREGDFRLRLTDTRPMFQPLAVRHNPPLEVPPWFWWAIGGAAAASVIVSVANASSSPSVYPSVRTNVPNRAEYDSLFSTCVVGPSHLAAVDRLIDRVQTNRARYEQVQGLAKVPWWFIAAVHNLEGSMDFTTHLHNGDPLTARTFHVPPGRPVAGNPPFTWEESALDALAYDHVSGWQDWTVGGALYKLEGYNGWGYRRQGIHSPYLWSYSNHYTRGKYVADGVWDPNAVSEQCGGGSLWRRMVDKGIIRIET